MPPKISITLRTFKLTQFIVCSCTYIYYSFFLGKPGITTNKIDVSGQSVNTLTIKLNNLVFNTIGNLLTKCSMKPSI